MGVLQNNETMLEIDHRYSQLLLKDGAGMVVLKDTVTTFEENFPSPTPAEFSIESAVERTENPCSS